MSMEAKVRSVRDWKELLSLEWVSVGAELWMVGGPWYFAVSSGAERLLSYHCWNAGGRVADNSLNFSRCTRMLRRPVESTFLSGTIAITPSNSRIRSR